MFSASIIADSKNSISNDRLTSFVVTYPRIIHAEMCRHRLHSRNSASSRAIPFKRMLKDIEDNPFVPHKWMKKHKGMQGTEYLDESEVEEVRQIWVEARNLAIQQAKKLSNEGVTKQKINRLLEPFFWHTEIISATEWENFFALRVEEGAEIHFQTIASKMLEEMNNSTPQVVSSNDYVSHWHKPFADNTDFKKAQQELTETVTELPESFWFLKIAVARCARVSYENFHGEDDYASDVSLHDKLKNSGHMSPFEHVARPMTEEEYTLYSNSYIIGTDQKVGDRINRDIEQGGIELKPIRQGNLVTEYGWCKNFRGFIQYRQLIPNENLTDSRIIEK